MDNIQAQIQSPTNNLYYYFSLDSGSLTPREQAAGQASTSPSSSSSSASSATMQPVSYQINPTPSTVTTVTTIEPVAGQQQVPQAPNSSSVICIREFTPPHETVIIVVNPQRPLTDYTRVSASVLSTLLLLQNTPTTPPPIKRIINAYGPISNNNPGPHNRGIAKDARRTTMRSISYEANPTPSIIVTTVTALVPRARQQQVPQAPNSIICIREFTPPCETVVVNPQRPLTDYTRVSVSVLSTLLLLQNTPPTIKRIINAYEPTSNNNPRPNNRDTTTGASRAAQADTPVASSSSSVSTTTMRQVSYQINPTPSTVATVVATINPTPSTVMAITAPVPTAKQQQVLPLWSSDSAIKAALMAAATNGNLEDLQRVLRPPYRQALSHEDLTLASNRAAANGQFEIFRRLVPECPCRYIGRAFCFAIENNHIRFIRSMLETYLSELTGLLEERQYLGFALRDAVVYHRLEIVELFSQSYSAYIPDVFLGSAIERAVTMGFREILGCLLRNFSNRLTRDDIRTALRSAHNAQRLEICGLLNRELQARDSRAHQG